MSAILGLTCRPVPDRLAPELAERRGFQPLEVALSGGRLRQYMFGDFECGGRAVAMEAGIEQHFVQCPAQYRNRCGVIAHARCYTRPI
jgi:hypothetical protein